MDQIDYDLLRVRKKVIPILQEQEKQNLKLIKKLEARETLEIEEIKRRFEEEEEMRFQEYSGASGNRRVNKVTSRSGAKNGSSNLNGGKTKKGALPSRSENNVLKGAKRSAVTG